MELLVRVLVPMELLVRFLVRMVLIVLLRSLILGSFELLKPQLSSTSIILPAFGADPCLLEWSLILKLWLLLAWLKLHSLQRQPLQRLQLAHC